MPEQVLVVGYPAFGRIINYTPNNFKKYSSDKHFDTSLCYHKFMKVVRIVFTLLIGIFTSLAVLAAIVILVVKFNNQSLVGKWLKDKVIRYPEVVRIVNLNEPGDAKFLYLDFGQPEISVKLVYTKSGNPSEKVEKWAGEMIGQTTGKNMTFTSYQDDLILEKDAYSDNDLNQIRDNLIKNSPNDVDLFIIYLTERENVLSHVGLVLHRDTIFMFRNALNDLTSNTTLSETLEKTTLMHEWGHLLGIKHVDSPECIMSEMVEVIDSYLEKGNVPEEYCEEVLYKLQREIE